MDPFEDFEFKPLTEGLGFHKKKATEATSETQTEFKVKPEFNLNTPLPRKSKEEIKNITAQETSSAVDEILKTLNDKRGLDFKNSNEDQAKINAKITAKNIAQNTYQNKQVQIAKSTSTDSQLQIQKIKTDLSKITATEKKSTTAPQSIGALFLDGLLIVAAQLLCMIIMLVVTKVDLVANLTQPDAQNMVYFATAALFAGVAWIYLVVNRAFLGQTPGEWVFDMTLGQTEQTATASYALRTMARSTLVILTGFFVLPLLSVITRKDLAGKITGLELQKKA